MRFLFHEEHDYLIRISFFTFCIDFVHDTII